MSKIGPAGTTMTWAEVWAKPRVPGDDDTDHIVRHAYGIDPDKEYRGAKFGGTPETAAYQRAAASEKRKRVSQPRARPTRAPAARPRARAAAPKVSLSKLVSIGLSEAPGSGVTVTRLVDQHIKSGKPTTRHRLFGMPLVITTRGKTVRVAFAMEAR